MLNNVNDKKGNVLITGGAGFVGSYLTSRLLSEGFAVHILDSKTSYSPIDLSLQQKNAEFLSCLREGAVGYHHVDTQNYEDVIRLLSDYEYKCIVHLAAMPLATVAIERPMLAYDVIATGTRNIVEALRVTKASSRFIYVSSSMVYGDFKGDIAYERDECRPKEIYGSFKYSGEIITQAYRQRYGLDALIARPSAVYGPGDSNNRVIQSMITKALISGSISAVDPDETLLDFTYVEDLAHCLAGLCTVAKSPNDDIVFNVTRGRARSLREVANLIKSVLPHVNIEETHNKENFRPKRGTLSNEKIRELMGGHEFKDIEEIVPNYINFIESTL